MAKKQKTKVYKEPQRYQALTDGGRTAFGELREKADPNTGFKGYSISEQEANNRAWQSNRNLRVNTRTASGRLSIDGRTTNGAVTWAMTPKNDDGTPVLNKRGEARQSGRSRVANRRQRDYDNRKAMNNITQRLVDRWKELGWVREVDGNLMRGGRVIRQKADGNYTMGLTTG